MDNEKEIDKLMSDDWNGYNVTPLLDNAINNEFDSVYKATFVRLAVELIEMTAKIRLFEDKIRYYIQGASIGDDSSDKYTALLYRQMVYFQEELKECSDALKSFYEYNKNKEK